MNKNIILVLMLLYISLMVYPDDKVNKFISRTAAVLPIVNNSEIKDYDFFSNLIEDNLRNNFADQFTVIDREKTKDADVYAKNYNTELIEDYALTIKADIVIYGEFFINNDEININIKCFDVIKRVVTDNLNYKVNIKSDLTYFAMRISGGFALKIKESFSVYDEALVEMIRNSDKEENKRKKIIENFFNNNLNHYWNYILNKDKNKEYITIPFAKNIVIFYCETEGDYTVKAAENSNETDTKIKFFTFDDTPGNQIDFTIRLKNNQEIIFKYKQIKKYEVTVKYIKIVKDKLNDYIVFIDNSVSLSTAAVLGYDLKFGFGVPFKSKMDNNFYLKAFMGIKFINPVNIGNELSYEEPYYKFRISAGYEHVFYLKKILAVQVGLDFGYEFYIFNFLIKNGEKIKYSDSIWGCPGFSFAFPVAFQFFTNSRFNLIFGFEPVLRFVMSYYYVNNTPIREYLDDTRGTLLDFLRFQIDDYLTVDLFIYDMPVFLAFRIKI